MRRLHPLSTTIIGVVWCLVVDAWVTVQPQAFPSLKKSPANCDEKFPRHPWMPLPRFLQYSHSTKQRRPFLLRSSPISEGELLDLNLILIDYYDSFTYNLVHLLSRFCCRPPIVLAADCATSYTELLQKANVTTVDGIILSPGPGHPKDVAAPLALDIIRNRPHLPILGVCLGHQILGLAYGAQIQLAPEPIHGQVRTVHLVSDDDDDLWKNLSSPLEVTRYHSLCVTDIPSNVLQVTAVSCNDNSTEEMEVSTSSITMAMKHVQNPHYGVQFHPESIGTPQGAALLRNFCHLVASNQQQQTRASNASMGAHFRPPQQQQDQILRCEPILTASDQLPNNPKQEEKQQRQVMVFNVNSMAQPEDVMVDILASEQYSFWLDSSNVRDGGDAAISILGSSQDRVEYWGSEKPSKRQGLFQWRDFQLVEQESSNDDILSYLQAQHQKYATDSVVVIRRNAQGDDFVHETFPDGDSAGLPFQFRGGHVGFLGYEVRHDTMRFLEEQEQGSHRPQMMPLMNSPQHSDSSIPSAAFLVADRSFVFDHAAQSWYLVGSSSSESERETVLEWIQETANRLEGWAPSRTSTRLSSTRSDAVEVPFVAKRSRSTYNHNFDQCIEHIRQGDSYELCLTNQLEAKVDHSRHPLDLYRRLRRINPAPYSAYFHWSDSFSICCSSPERFLTISKDSNRSSTASTNRHSNPLWVETKPIKGTRARVSPRLTAQQKAADRLRALELSQSIKDRAENLMIVDLLRNDLSRVCDDVHVSKLMAIESFATVHQMVSTIRGTLHQDKDSVDVLRACFPGGSMTGAPKRRTMELLNELEEHQPRGPYSGCLGYLSWNGCMDMNIVIRTAILERQAKSTIVRIGAGGAITALSEAIDEYDELMLKASAIVRAVQGWVNTDSESDDDKERISSTEESTFRTSTAGNHTSQNHTITLQLE